MINIRKYRDIDSEVKIIFTDNTFVIGKIDSIDDDEESDLGEEGISVFTREGRYLGIGKSEIERIEIMSDCPL